MEQSSEASPWIQEGEHEVERRSGVNCKHRRNPEDTQGDSTGQVLLWGDTQERGQEEPMVNQSRSICQEAHGSPIPQQSFRNVDAASLSLSLSQTGSCYAFQVGIELKTTLCLSFWGTGVTGMSYHG